MATLNSLKDALKQAAAPSSLSNQLLSDEQYSVGFDIMLPEREYFEIPCIRAQQTVCDESTAIAKQFSRDEIPTVRSAMPARHSSNAILSSERYAKRYRHLQTWQRRKIRRHLILSQHVRHEAQSQIHRTASFPTGAVSVSDDDDILDRFAAFIAGYVIEDVKMNGATRAGWRKVCRTLGRREAANPNQLYFSSPCTMVAFNKHGTALPELATQVPLLEGERAVKNREAVLHHPASIVRPTGVQQVQQCVKWALKHKVGLTIIGGSHSGHCLWSNVVAVDMSAFNKIHILMAQDDVEGYHDLVIVGVGCKTGEIVQETMAAGLTVPLGARPSVGAGLWLQGGIGHLARLYGLTCDAIVGAVAVGLETSQVYCIGNVPHQHRPVGAVCPENEHDFLWAIKGAGTNFCIVISVTFRAFVAPTISTRNWVITLRDKHEAKSKLNSFDNQIAGKLPHNCSADIYLYWDVDQLRLGITTFESSTGELAHETPVCTFVRTILGEEDVCKTVDSVDLFEADMYMSGMHGGHSGGKTSSFKRCLFMKGIGAFTEALVAAIKTRPSPFCYFHLLHGGGAVRDIAVDATAFGCRDWDFACVITGVWPRDQDNSEFSRTVVGWVYSTAKELMPLSSGVYSADLGPDPRDYILAAKAFGPNGPRLAHLKRRLDPHTVLAYACPLRIAAIGQKLIILVTGESGAGKDYCAGIWASTLNLSNDRRLKARTASISDATKREYAAATGADLDRLLGDRAYKEQHRPTLTMFFQEQVQQRPRLPEEHFLSLVHHATGVDVLLITGMRDEALVSAFSYLVPQSRLLEVRVQASEDTRRVRRGCHCAGDDNYEKGEEKNDGKVNLAAKDCPSLIFNNDTAGNNEINNFAEKYFLPFFGEHFQRLSNMVRLAADFPRSGIEFHHVLNIAQQPGGLALCTSLLRTQFASDWGQVNAIACCEAGGFLYASPLAAQVDIPLALIRVAGKLPPPTVSVVKSASHISSSTSERSRENEIEIGRDVIPRGASVVVVDDVLATGNTLFAVLQLLKKADVNVQKIGIMVVAEFPIHRGRELLRRNGFGGVPIQSLLVFGGA